MPAFRAGGGLARGVPGPGGRGRPQLALTSRRPPPLRAPTPGAAEEQKSFWAGTYCRCAGDKTSDSLIDGFADLTIPCESTEWQSLVLIYGQLQGELEPEDGKEAGGKSPSL